MRNHGFSFTGPRARYNVSINTDDGSQIFLLCDHDVAEVRIGNNNTELAILPTIFMEFRSTTLAACKQDAETCEEIALCYDATKVHISEKGEEMDQMWQARRGCYLAAGKYRQKADASKSGDQVRIRDPSPSPAPHPPLPRRRRMPPLARRRNTDRLSGESLLTRSSPLLCLASMNRSRQVYLSDTCVPISKLSESIAKTEEDFLKNGFKVSCSPRPAAAQPTAGTRPQSLDHNKTLWVFFGGGRGW